MSRLHPYIYLIFMASSLGCQTPGGAATELRAVKDSEKVAVLGPSDIIEIKVYGEPELSGLHQVAADGSIRLPLVGTLQVEGSTPESIRNNFEIRLNEKFLKDAQVNVVVKKYNSRRIYVVGQVKTPGNYEYETRMTVIGAVSRAGGTTRLANANQTILTRGQGLEQERIVIQLGDIRRGDATDIELLPGDIIYVPEALF
jgi:polysaccharide biosynthesis/export protein